MAYTKSSIELEYVFLGMKFDVEFLEGSFTDDEKKDILDFIDGMSRAIYIDKSYVDCKENKRKDTFMLESGWNSLREVILDTRFCKYTYGMTEEVLVDAFTTMGRCYMYDCLSKKTDKFTQVNIEVKEDCEFEVVICKDVAHDYKNYLGKWQDWEFDDEGRFLSSHVDDKEYAEEVKPEDEVNRDDE